LSSALGDTRNPYTIEQLRRAYDRLQPWVLVGASLVIHARIRRAGVLTASLLRTVENKDDMSEAQVTALHADTEEYLDDVILLKETGRLG